MGVRGCILGDSLFAAAGYALPIEGYLFSADDIRRGYTANNIAVSGANINSQKASWEALLDQGTYDWVAVGVGINDRDPAVSFATTIGQYQDLIDSINALKKASCKVVVSTLTPCHSFLLASYGPVQGEVAQTKWLSMNEAIAGQGACAITGADVRASAHTSQMSDPFGDLWPIYDAWDGLHISAAGRTCIAADWRIVMQAVDFFTEDTRLAQKPYPWRIAG